MCFYSHFPTFNERSHVGPRPRLRGQMSAAKKQQRIGAVVKTEFMLFLCELSPQLKWNYEISQMFCGTKVLFFKNTDTREDPWLQSTHILEVKVKVPSEVAVEDPRITDGRHRGYCPDLDIVCSLVTTIYYPQSRPSPILDISRTAAATCHPLQLMFCQDLRISPCCRIFCKTTQQNRC